MLALSLQLAPLERLRQQEPLLRPQGLALALAPQLAQQPEVVSALESEPAQQGRQFLLPTQSSDAQPEPEKSSERCPGLQGICDAGQRFVPEVSAEQQGLRATHAALNRVKRKLRAIRAERESWDVRVARKIGREGTRALTVTVTVTVTQIRLLRRFLVLALMVDG